MNERHIHDAIGEISEELIAPVAKLRQKKRYPALKWVAVAACLCLLLSLPLGWNLRNGVKAENAVGAPEMNGENLYGGLQDKADGASGTVVAPSVFLAKVLEVDDGCALVEPLEGEQERLCSDRIYVSFGDLKNIPEIKAGDILQITYSGMIQESYPAQIGGTISITVTE